MNKFLEEARIPICTLSLKSSQKPEFNYAAQPFLAIQAELTKTFKSMITDKTDVLLKRFISEELFLFHFSSNTEFEIFIFFNSAYIDQSVLEMDIIKSARNEMDVILNSIHDDILITNGEGLITKVYPSFEIMYNVKKENVEGKSIYELEKEGVFNPSITALVLKQKQQITRMQQNNEGRKIIVTAVPIKGQDEKIIKVISFSRDITEFLNLKEQYDLLDEKVKKYSAEIENLRINQIKFPGLVVNSKIMEDVMSTVDKVSGFDANIVLEGESGVGKTMFAKLIHSKSLRSQGPFIEINCGSIPANLMESELFGYEKGAFTGANVNGKIGLIQLADKGTLFFDEIGELPLDLQTKLLKVIQDKKIIRIGGTKVINVDFRLITATNKNLKDLVAEQLFREDLYYRLNVIYIKIPSLRDRKDDIFNLAIYFLNYFNNKYHLEKSFSTEAIDCFMNYKWPGNIRELENLIERMVLTSEDNRIVLTDFPESFRHINYLSNRFTTLDEAIEQFEKHLVTEAYKKHKTTVGVAKELGISQPTAVRKIKKHISN